MEQKRESPTFTLDLILVGLFCNLLSLEFILLQYILPAAGTLLLMHGFRNMGQECPYFRCGFLFSILRFILLAVELIVGSTIWFTAFSTHASAIWMGYCNLSVMFAILFCFWRGFGVIQKKSGTSTPSRAASLLLVWYAALTLLALFGDSGTILSLALLFLLVLLFVQLIRQSAALTEGNYTIVLPSFRISCTAVTVICISTLLLCMTTGYVLFDQYPMDWALGQTPEADENLLELGFPVEILTDLREEDIAACQGATLVHVEEETVTNGQLMSMRITHVAVKLPETQNGSCWRIFHHFLWLEPPTHYGADTLQLIPTSQNGAYWQVTSEYTGQLLYDGDVFFYSAPYYRLEESTYESWNDFYVQNFITIEAFGEFSFPRGGSNYRGYISYEMFVPDENVTYLVTSGVNYIHQGSSVQFPVMTAKARQMSGTLFSSSGPFHKVRGILQFVPNDVT